MNKITKESRIIVGIDEAGRGPVLGPLVICVYAINEKNVVVLKQMGARDSKTLSPNRRAKLYEKLTHLAVEIKTKHITPAEIDELRKNYSLNVIEQKMMLKLAKELQTPFSELYIDAADVNEQRFGLIFEQAFPKAKIISKHKADILFPVVSAASIIAKVERDKEIEKISQSLGIEIGSGYPSDPKTKKFLREIYKKKGKFPSFVRESWDTVKKIKAEFAQPKKLSDFMV
ncbi:MAG: ribonuclease HII [Candidatus Heimdallarchaeaceae archaeon]